jgi:hypothetical protein
VYVGIVTVPVSGIVCDVAGAATLMFSVWLMVSGVVAVGLKVTLMVQDAFTAIGVPIVQLLFCRNWPVFVPANVMPVIVSVEVPVFVTVTACATLVVLSGELNVRVVGVAESTGAVAVPLKATEATGTPASEVVNTKEVLEGPTAVGANRIKTLQLRPALRLVPH